MMGTHDYTNAISVICGCFAFVAVISFRIGTCLQSIVEELRILNGLRQSETGEGKRNGRA